MAFVDTALVALRESLEAFLLVGILSGIVVKLGHPTARKPILWGAFLGAVAAVVLGLLAQGIAAKLYDKNAAIFEGLASLVAVAILSYMVVWMYRHTRALMGTLHDRAKGAIEGERPGILFTLAFVAVLREGIETVLFIAGKFPVDGGAATSLAVLVGVAASAVVAWLLFSRVVKLSIQGFFTVTGAILVVVGAGLMVTVVHELSEPKAEGGPGWLPETPVAFDASKTLPTECEDGQPTTTACTTGGILHAAFGYQAAPHVAELVAWGGYIAAFAVGYALSRRRPVKAGGSAA
jgi:high-affinity iron transporter